MAKGFDCPGPHEVDLLHGIEADRVDPLPVAPSLLAQEVSIRFYALPLPADHCGQFILRKPQARVEGTTAREEDDQSPDVEGLRQFRSSSTSLEAAWRPLGRPE